MTQQGSLDTVNSDCVTTACAGLPCSQIELLFRSDPARGQAERFIADKYRRIYNAELQHFLPIIIRISQADATVGAFGLRPGHYRPMFLEQYLDAPIEHQVAELSRQPVDRSSLAEVGNLVVSRNGYGPLLLVTLAMSLARAGYQWMVFTVTEQVERLLKRLGFNPQQLVLADPDRLSADKCSWGTYYANKPRVMVGNISRAETIIGMNPKLCSLALQYQNQCREIASALSRYRRLKGE